jgi:hypothetical protein
MRDVHSESSFAAFEHSSIVDRNIVIEKKISTTALVKNGALKPSSCLQILTTSIASRQDPVARYRRGAREVCKVRM